MLVKSSSHNTALRRKVGRDEEKEALYALEDKRSKRDSQPRRFGWRPASYERTVTQFKSPPDGRRGSKESVQSQASPPDSFLKSSAGRFSPRNDALLPHSSPVDVPGRSARVSPNTVTSSLQKASQSQSQNQPRRLSGGGHNHKSSVSPSVSAVLIGTQIPRRKAYPQRDLLRSASHRRQSLSELQAEWDKAEPEGSPLGSSLNMDLLLAAPEDEFSLAEGAIDEGSPRWSSIASRTMSSDSIPSLEPDSLTKGSSSTSNSPAMRARSRNNLERPPKVSPHSVEAESHPLIRNMFAEDEEDIDYDFQDSSDAKSFSSSSRRSDIAPTSTPRDFARTPRRTSSPRPISLFKSNLTASFAALKSAARSFSNFAAPSIAPDDHVSRGLLGAPYHPEMRPRPIQGTPTAAMRRYLNPQHPAPAGDFHLHGVHFDHTDLESLASLAVSEDLLTGTSPPETVIALQSLNRSNTPSPSSASEAGRAMNLPLQGQEKPRREPRENNEFLRICVLEMNMRRSGKMEGPVGLGQGRRAWWLPPRSLDSKYNYGDNNLSTQSVKQIPPRWISTAA